MATARYLRENLRFVITQEKSVFVPTQKLEFLGFVINTIDMMILVLPDDKVRSIKSLCTNLLEQKAVSVRDLSQLIGKLTSSRTSSIRVVPREMVTTHVYPYQGRPRRRFTKYVSIGIVQNKDWTCGPVDPWTRGPVDPWTRGPVDPWTRGPVDPWTRGPIDGFAVGQHPLDIRLLKGVLDLRPATPRYQRSWDVSVVLNYLRSQPNNNDLPLKSLSRKLAILLAVTAPKRSSELQLLDIRFMCLHPEGVEFKLPGLTKTTSEFSSAFLAKFEKDHKICVLRCLQTREFHPF